MNGEGERLRLTKAQIDVLRDIASVIDRDNSLVHSCFGSPETRAAIQALLEAKAVERWAVDPDVVCSITALGRAALAKDDQP
jgi:hypothetical protein